MRRNIRSYSDSQVFLNYPFDAGFITLADALSFSVVAGGLLPVCALDLSTPDLPRLEMLVEAIQSCRYSVHDLSRAVGEGVHNLARMNMPIEMGMALFHALQTQRHEHRCLFFVPEADQYKAFASDLSGLDPMIHNNEESRIVVQTYEWLRGIVPHGRFNSLPAVEIVDKYAVFKERRARLRGSGLNGAPSHSEARELMYQLGEECEWWDWRRTRHGKEEFPLVPLAFIA